MRSEVTDQPVSPLLRFPLYPAVFAAAFAMARYLSTNQPAQVALRPLLVVVLVVVVLQLVLTLITRDRRIGAFAATFVFLAIADPIVALLVIFAATAPLLLGLLRKRQLGAMQWGRLTAFFSVIASVALLVVIPTMSGRIAGLPGPTAIGAGRTVLPTDPDIYAIMLDGYPRADTLATAFAYDNHHFLDAMSELGFDVAENSHSNYNATMLTLSSVWNMQQVSAVIPNPPDRALHGSALMASINNGAALGTLRSAGYRVISIPSGITTTSIFASDVYLDTGQVNSFEMAVMHAGILPSLAADTQRSWMYQQQRDRIHAAFEALESLAGQAEPTPRFVFAHVIAPHSPIVFRADGSAADELACLPRDCTIFDEHRNAEELGRIPEQIEYLNQLVLRTVRQVISLSTRPVVVIVFSDHGARHDLDDRDEMLRNLFLSYTPAHAGLFPDDATPVNLVPQILNAYMGMSIPLASEESYQIVLESIGTSGYFPLTPWPVD